MFRKLLFSMAVLVVAASAAYAKPQPRAIKIETFSSQSPYYISLVAVGKQTGIVYAAKVVTVIAGNTLTVKFNTDDDGYYDGLGSKTRSGVTGDNEVEDAVPIPASVPIPFTEGPYRNMYIDDSGGSQTVYIICEY